MQSHARTHQTKKRTAEEGYIAENVTVLLDSGI